MGFQQRFFARKVAEEGAEDSTKLVQLISKVYHMYIDLS